MSQQPNTNQPQIEKLLIDNPSNFQFHAAYLVYSETFDKANEEAKKELNQNLEDLKSNKINYETFYNNISRHRKLEPMARQAAKFTVATQRKKDWRIKTQKQERIKRHKK
jgi:signal recognition particle GTPase